MHLAPHERDKLLVYVAAKLAEERLARGVLLNHPEAIALITKHILEGARDGKSVATLMQTARCVLRVGQVMDGVPSMIDEVHVEATFPDGTKLVVAESPIHLP
ncbi:urease subunit gamma [Actinophytocola xinjiangensis]|uniref:Urease subunit gamma n=1 Tax=Actinophytocola xinjiangensis TaxID=485602 RepID=A0A7Z1AWW9_9PSEU|nr:urease subunit gamma [Actinophytocola xinjiangensis]OLF08359.1 urease subunit gamma [Actinophytocola xinjiangensis]